jgi:hypothetical protein
MCEILLSDGERDGLAAAKYHETPVRHKKSLQNSADTQLGYRRFRNIWYNRPSTMAYTSARLGKEERTWT